MDIITIKKLLIERLTPTAKLPTRAHYNDAGLDIYADESLILKPGQRHIFKTGLKMVVPDGYAALVWDKGGLAAQGLHTIAGVIDAGYRGEVIIGLVNLSDQDYTVEQGQKIAQILIQPISLCAVQENKITDTTERQDGHHGSTGLF